jgi:hypothetical protein
MATKHSSHSGTPLGVGTSHGHFDSLDSPRPEPREYATTILPIVYFVTLGGTHARMSLFPGTPGTPGLESRNCPETVPGGVLGLWELITPDCGVWSRQGLNQTCISRRDLFNDVSQSRFEGQEKVDSWLLVIGSQTDNLTPGPSFAHNLGYRCSNGQCEAIFYIYASRPFPMTPRTRQCEVFWALLSSSEHSGVPEDSKSSLFPSVGLHPHTWPK